MVLYVHRLAHGLPTLPERNNACIAAYETLPVRLKQQAPGCAVIDILGDLRGDQPRQIGTQPGDQAGRDHAAGGQRIRRWRRGERVRIDVASGVERGDERLLASLCIGIVDGIERSEEHTSELQSLMRNQYAVFCLKKKKK